jgi:hypothetical protein
MKQLGQAISSTWQIWLGFLLGLLLYFIQMNAAWPLTRWAGIDNGPLAFGDFKWLATWSESCATQADWGVILSSSNLSQIEGCTSFNYGQALLLLLKLFPLTEASYIPLAVALGALSSGVIGGLGMSLLRMKSRARFGVTTILLFLALYSPGTSLLFERGNLDMVVLLILISGAILLAKHFSWIAIALITLASLIKLYALPLLMTSLVFVKNRLAIAVWVAVFGLACLAAARDLTRIRALPGDGFVQFGRSAFDHYFSFIGLEPHSFFGLIGLVLPLTTFAILLKTNFFSSRVTEIAQGLSQYSTSRLTWLTCSVIFVSCYVAGLNYDYRLIFLALAGSATAIRMSSLTSRFLSWSTLLLALWGSALFPAGLFEDRAWRILVVGPLQVVGDLCISLWVGLLASMLYIMMKDLVRTFKGNALNS